MTEADAYFGAPPSGEGAGIGAWYDLNTGVPPFEMVPGLLFRPIVGTNLAVNLVTLEPYTVAPVHAHPEEQVTYVLEGEFEFEINGEKRVLTPGMAAVIPPNTPHGARTHDKQCVELDIFSPPRQGLLNAMKNREAQGTGDTSGGTA